MISSTSALTEHSGQRQFGSQQPETIDCAKGLFRPLKCLFPYKQVNTKNIRMSVIAYWLNERKMPLEDVQVMAGHKWPSSTEKYKREDMEEQRRLINACHPLNSH